MHELQPGREKSKHLSGWIAEPRTGYRSLGHQNVHDLRIVRDNETFQPIQDRLCNVIHIACDGIVEKGDLHPDHASQRPCLSVRLARADSYLVPVFADPLPPTGLVRHWWASDHKIEQDLRG